MPNITIQRIKTPDDRSLAIFEETEQMMRRIRERAFSLFSSRGFGDGRALDDWLAAEREFCWPRAELVERDHDFVLEVALPGFEPAEITLTAAPRELIVRAKSAHAAESKKDERPLWSELRSNDVYRRVELDKDVDVEKVSASLKNGLLRVAATKVEKPVTTVTVASAA
jgi:HSP20 family protein